VALDSCGIMIVGT